MKDLKWVSFALSQSMKDELDAYCDDNGYTRSEFLRLLVRNALRE